MDAKAGSYGRQGPEGKQRQSKAQGLARGYAGAVLPARRGHARPPGAPDLLHRIPAHHVHHIQRRPHKLGQPDGARRGLPLQRRRPRQGVALWAGDARIKHALLPLCHRISVLRVHLHIARGQEVDGQAGQGCALVQEAQRVDASGRSGPQPCGRTCASAPSSLHRRSPASSCSSFTIRAPAGGEGW